MCFGWYFNLDATGILILIKMERWKVSEKWESNNHSQQAFNFTLGGEASPKYSFANYGLIAESSLIW